MLVLVRHVTREMMQEEKLVDEAPSMLRNHWSIPGCRDRQCQRNSPNETYEHMPLGPPASQNEIKPDNPKWNDDSYQSLRQQRHADESVKTDQKPQLPPSAVRQLVPQKQGERPRRGHRNHDVETRRARKHDQTQTARRHQHRLERKPLDTTRAFYFPAHHPNCRNRQ